MKKIFILYLFIFSFATMGSDPVVTLSCPSHQYLGDHASPPKSNTWHGDNTTITILYHEGHDPGDDTKPLDGDLDVNDEKAVKDFCQKKMEEGDFVNEEPGPSSGTGVTKDGIHYVCPEGCNLLLTHGLNLSNGGRVTNSTGAESSAGTKGVFCTITLPSEHEVAGGYVTCTENDSGTSIIGGQI